MAIVIVCLFFMDSMAFADIRQNTLAPELLFSNAENSAEIRAALICGLIERRAEQWQGKTIEQIYLEDMLEWRKSTEPLFEGFEPVLAIDRSQILIAIPGSDIYIRYYRSDLPGNMTLIPFTDWKTTEIAVITEVVNRQIMRRTAELPFSGLIPEKRDSEDGSVRAEIIDAAIEFGGRTGAFLRSAQKEEEVGEIEPDAHLEVDKRAHELLVKEITRKFPGHNVISEEEEDAGSFRDDAPFTWLLDPLCGTSAFKKGLKNYGVGIMCFRSDTMEPVVAVHYGYPYERGEPDVKGKKMVMLHATREGAFIDGKRITISGSDGLTGKEAFVARHRTIRDHNEEKVFDPLHIYRDRLREEFDFAHVPEE
ncbi:MAG: hypothetical protein KAS86_01835, partial [Candidatus Omnitrophica bacterium]|nr:hypothetical protein [Candidatus Omnitrophota bacterium]